MERLELIGIFRTLHQKKKTNKQTECTFLTSAHATFSKTDHRLGQKTSLNKFKRLEIISSLFHNNNMKLEINHWKRNKEKKRVHGV